jgi:branched-chain amino acid transport system substrate-binding protein
MNTRKNGTPGAARALRQSTIAAVAALAALAGMAPGLAQSQTIKIGVPVPLSGSSANAGTDIVNGAKLAAARINAAGGVLGKQIELVPEDDACDAQTAVQAAQKLVDAGVVAVAGGYCSSAALPELTTFHRAGIPYVLDASTNPKLTEMGYDGVFRTIGRDDEQGPFAASFIKNSLHAKRAAVINDNTTYAKGLADNTVEALKKDGVDVVYNDAITPGQMDYSPTLTHVASLNPDVIYYTGYFSEAGLIVKEARQLGLKMTLMGGDGTNDPTLMKTAGPAADGMIITTAPLAQFLSGAHSLRKPTVRGRDRIPSTNTMLSGSRPKRSQRANPPLPPRSLLPCTRSPTTRAQPGRSALTRRATAAWRCISPSLCGATILRPTRSRMPADTGWQ